MSSLLVRVNPWLERSLVIENCFYWIIEYQTFNDKNNLYPVRKKQPKRFSNKKTFLQVSAFKTMLEQEIYDLGGILVSFCDNQVPAKSVPWGRFLALPLSSTRLVDFWNISDNISIYVFFLSTVKQGVSGDQIHLHLNSLHFCQIYQNFNKPQYFTFRKVT